MNEQHKAAPSSGWNATPEQWADQEIWAASSGDSSCILELRARVEALEAASRRDGAPVYGAYNEAGELQGVVPASAFPSPAGSLVERVGPDAIREVAAWLGDLPGWEGSTLDAIGALLEQEATR
jgi:hypothetical protein